MKTWLAVSLFIASVFAWHILTNSPIAEILTYILYLGYLCIAVLLMALMCVVFLEFANP